MTAPEMGPSNLDRNSRIVGRKLFTIGTNKGATSAKMGSRKGALSINGIICRSAPTDESAAMNAIGMVHRKQMAV